MVLVVVAVHAVAAEQEEVLEAVRPAADEPEAVVRAVVRG